MSSTFLTADFVKTQVRALLNAYPELREDDEALVLSLESETDAVELCGKLVRGIKENEAHDKGLELYLKELKARREAFERRDIRLRAILLQVMEAAGVKTLRLPVGTLSASPSRKVIIVERENVPDEYRRHPDWEPKKKEIGAALKAGKAVPGCVLSNPEPHLSIR